MKEIKKQFGNQVESREGMKLTKAIAKSSKSYALPLFIGYFLTMVSNLCLPIVTNKVISYIDTGNTTISLSLMYVGLIFLVKFVKNVALSNLCYRMAVFGFNLSNNLGICIFNKALKFPTLCNKSVTIAELINYT